MTQEIRLRDRNTILQALGTGLVPRTGLQHIQVGRKGEVDAILGDLEALADGGARLRAIVGAYGAGKSFFLALSRNLAQEKSFATMHADLTPGRLLIGKDGQARGLYSELASSLATRTRPEGGALPGIVEKFISTCKTEAEQTGREVNAVIKSRLGPLEAEPLGESFSIVVRAYCDAHLRGDDKLRHFALRWLNGQYKLKSDARRELNVDSIVDDNNLYAQLKVVAHFVRLAGYKGLFVCLDELMTLFRISHPVPRNNNYQVILNMVNDLTQGRVTGLGVMLAITPEVLQNPTRGLHSLEELKVRLGQNVHAGNNLAAFNRPVMWLQNLTAEDFHVLLENILRVHCLGDKRKQLLPDEAIAAFMRECNKRLGENYFGTPRTAISSFVDLLEVIERNPGLDWKTYLPGLTIQPDRGEEPGDDSNPGDPEGGDDDDPKPFKLR